MRSGRRSPLTSMVFQLALNALHNESLVLPLRKMSSATHTGAGSGQVDVASSRGLSAPTSQRKGLLQQCQLVQESVAGHVGEVERAAGAVSQLPGSQLAGGANGASPAPVFFHAMLA